MRRPSMILTGILIVSQSFSSVYAQPVAFTHSVQTLEHTEVIVPEPIDLQTVLEEDQQRESQMGPYPFAVPRSVHITPETNGLWEQIDNEILLWRLPIASPEALSLSLGFTRYSMPPGGRMYIYSIDENQVIGPFTQKDNKEHGQLWTPIINSEAIIVELTIPSLHVPDLELELSYINHGYRGLNSISLFGVGDSDWCQRNVACPEGNDWRDQIRSVARYDILVEHGPDYFRLGYCTGALINNTAQDNKPYFLTAFHCFDADRDLLLDEAEKEKTKTMVLYWNFQAKECDGSDDYDAQYQSGANFRAGYWKSDFALVELDNMPPSAADVYYAGWDCARTAPSGGVAIHHPKQDLKKISIENDPLYLRPTSVNHGDETNPISVNHGDCFQVRSWDVGITEKGSSGGPLFDLNSRRITGQSLSGACACDTPCVSSFGPLYRSWSEGETRATRLSDWLDPIHAGVTFLDGKDHEHQACDVITIGQEYIPHIYPLATEYQDSRTQVIYLANEIGRTGLIRGLALDVVTIPGQRMNHWTIRMKHTSKNQFSPCSLEETGWTEVYRSNQVINTTGWNWFEFQTPFEYNGTDNLMVDFRYDNGSSSRHGQCRWSSATGERGLCVYSNAPEGESPHWEGYCYKNILNIKLEICGLSEDKLIGWWNFNGDMLDSSGLDNHGTPVGDPTFVGGEFGMYTLHLDGDDYIVIDNVSDDITNNDITLSGWIKTIDDNGFLLASNGAPGGNVNKALWGIDDGKAAIFDGANWTYEVYSDMYVNDDVWHMLTYVRSGSTGYIYVDGQQEGTHTADWEFSSSDRWSIGQEWDDHTEGNFLTGTIDNVRIYDTALTASKIAYWYEWLR